MDDDIRNVTNSDLLDGIDAIYDLLANSAEVGASPEEIKQWQQLHDEGLAEANRRGLYMDVPCT